MSELEEILQHNCIDKFLNICNSVSIINPILTVKAFYGLPHKGPCFQKFLKDRSINVASKRKF